MITVEYWFDVDNYLLLQTIVDPDISKDDERVITRVDDYRKVGNIKMSCRSIQTAFGSKTTSVIDQVELNAEIDPKRFAMHPLLKY